MQLMTEVQRVRMLALAKAHQERDEYISGRYAFEGGGACSIGCTIHDAKKLGIIPDVTSYSDHASVGELLGHGQIMARLQDCIFEGLSQSRNKNAARKFTPKIIATIKTGADYSLAWPKFAVWLIREEFPTTTKDEKSLVAIDGVAKLYEEWVATGVKPDRSRFEAAANAAYAATYATYAAANAAYAATYAAANAAYAATYAAANAAYAATYATYAAANAASAAYAAYAARFKFWKRASTKFIEILNAV